MRRIASALVVASALLYADGLYTVSYMPESPVEAPGIETGIPNSVDAGTLLERRTKTAFNLYFEGDRLTKCSKERLDEALSNLSGDEYIALIGHSASATDPKADRYLNGWERFWQGLFDRRPTPKEAVEDTNDRLKYVYDLLQKNGVDADRIYTENRADRDPVATEATKKGSTYNRRVQVLILK